jgi:phosphotransferase system enzyme I (PtsI)
MRLLFPMVSTMEQVLEIEDTLDSVKREVSDEGGHFANSIPVGYMIEIPAAVEIAGKIARRADFLSIGTNDLVQYTLAIDRTNPKVAALYDPYHPAVIRMIHKTITAANKEKTPVSICGDMAAKPLLVPILWAMGVNSLSMNPSSIPKIKSLMQRLNFGELSKLTKRILDMDTGIEIRAALKAYFDSHKFGEYLDQAVDDGPKTYFSPIHEAS